MTTDTTALQERIAGALTEHWRAKHTTTGTPCSGCSAAVLPIIAAEVRAAKAEALREAAPLMHDHHDAAWLETQATEYETGVRA